MYKNDEIEMLLAELNEENLKQAGDLPSAEQFEAYLRDELMERKEKEQVRAMLVAHPELARAALWPDDDEISEAVVDQRWAAMRKKVGIAAPGRVLPFRRALPAIAAALAVVFASLFLQARWSLTRPTVAWNETLLSPDGHRGGADSPVALTPAGDSYFMVVPLIGQAPFDEYRLEIVRDGHALWRSSPLRRSSDDSFAILVPRSFLEPGSYQIILYGEDSSHDEKLATYSVSVPSR